MVRPAHASTVVRRRLSVAVGLLLSLAACLVALNFRGGRLTLRCPAFLQPMSSARQAGASAAAAGSGNGAALPVQHWLDAAGAGMARRGAKLSDKCDKQYGEGFMRTWQQGVEPGGRPFCSAGSGGDNGTTIRCHERPSSDGLTWPLCYASGPMLLARNSDDSFPPQVKLGCSKAAGNGTLQLQGRFHVTGQQLLGGGAQYEEDSETVAAQCAAAGNAVSHPVFFMTRHDFTNAYHGSEDLIMAFISLAILQREDPDTGWENAELVLLEEAAVPGPFLDVWAALFPAHPVRWLAKDPFPDGSCLQHAAFGVQGRRSLLSYIWVGNPTDCESIIVQAYSMWLRHMFGRPSAAAAPAADVQLPVTAGGFVMDNGEVEEASVLYVSRYVFEHIRKGKLTGWQSGRIIDNDPEVAMALMKAVEDWNAQSCILAEADLPLLNATANPRRRLMLWRSWQGQHQQRRRQLRRAQLLQQHWARRRLAATAVAEQPAQRPQGHQQQRRQQQQSTGQMQLPQRQHGRPSLQGWWPLGRRKRESFTGSKGMGVSAPAAAGAGLQHQHQQRQRQAGADASATAAADPGAADAVKAAAAAPLLQPEHIQRRRRLTQESEQTAPDGASADDAASTSATDAAVAAAAAEQQQRRQELQEDSDGSKTADASEWKPADGSPKPCRPGRLLFRLRTMELSLLPLRQQLEAVMSARILVGSHGAALANIIATEPGAAALLEMFVQGYTGNHHYQVMATLNADLYRSVHNLSPGQMDPAPVVAELMKLMDDTAAAHFRQLTGQDLDFVTNTTAGSSGGAASVQGS